MGVLVSINCMTYNHEDYIKDAIESFLMQVTDFEFEILIGEDCSTDNTKKIVERYVKEYPDKVKIITSDQNVGASENSVRLRKNSKGKYIAICEGDDYWIDPLKLQKQVDYLEKNSECTLCFHNAFVVKDRKEVKNKRMSTLIKKSNKYYHGGDSDYFAGELALLGFIPTASFMYRKHIMDNPPRWYFTAIVGDNPFKLITTSHGYAHYLDEVMSVYRVGVKGSVTDTWRKERGDKEKQIEINKGFIAILDNFNNYSNYKYSVEIDKAKIPYELNILERRNYFKKPRYKDYFKGLSLTEKVKYYTKWYFPSLYSLLARIIVYV